MLRDINWFKERLWEEVVRLHDGIPMRYTVTVTEDNVQTLYDSQFEDKTKYGAVFTYTDTEK